MSSLPATPDPDVLAAVTLACPLVAAMSGGVLGEVATYLPGRRIRGVRIAANGVDIHVVGVFGPSITEIVTQVRAAVEPLAAGRTLSVHVDDLKLPPPTRGPSRA
ncbi:MAG: hypothetical protein WKF47_15540 [Geodermatophilaceae bacterium]